MMRTTTVYRALSSGRAGRLTLTAALALVLLGLAAWLFVPPDGSGAVGDEVRTEHAFQSRPATCWVNGLADPDPAVRGEAVAALAAGGHQAVPVLREALRNNDAVVAQRAAAILVRLDSGKAAEAVPALGRALQSESPDDRKEAAHALGLAGPLAVAAAPVLAEALKDEDARVRVWAAWALWRVDESQAGPAFLALARAAEDETGGVRGLAAFALIGLEPRGEGHVRALLEALKGAPAVRSRAALVLGKVGPQVKTPVPALAEVLGAPDASTRLAAATALGRIGAPAKTALPRLTTALDDPSVWVRIRAAEALVKVGGPPESAVPTLTQASRSGHAQARVEAAAVLARVRPVVTNAPSGPARPPLLDTAATPVLSSR